MNSNASARPDPGRALLLIGVLAALGCWLLPAATAGAVEPAPAWHISMSTYPTNLEPGPLAPGEEKPGYVIIAENVGGERTSGEIRITDTLPEGIIPSHKPFFEGGVRAYIGRNVYFFPRFACNVVEQTVTCHGEHKIPSGEHIKVEIPIEVSPAATGVAVNTAEVEGGGAIAAASTLETSLQGGAPAFGFAPGSSGVSSYIAAADGSEISQAGQVPTGLQVAMQFPWLPARVTGESLRVPDGGVKSVSVNLPHGVVVDPNATPVKCAEVELESNDSCPAESQIGTITLSVAITGTPSFPTLPLYNMQAPPGVPAEFGFEALEGVYPHILGHVRSNGDYGLSADINTIPAVIGFLGATTDLWGVPSDEVHDEMRAACYETQEFVNCPVERTSKRFLTTPTSCEGPLKSSVSAVSWNHPGVVREGSDETSAMDGCNALSFDPTIESQATTNLADSPSGLEFNLHVPQAASIEQTVGKENVCGKGRWQGVEEGTLLFSYQWLRNGAPIAGASSRRYTTQPEDAGSLLQCEVAAISEVEGEPSGQSRAFSPPAQILPAPSTSPPSAVEPTIEVTSEVGETKTLSCNPGPWGGSPTFAYQWFANGSPAVGQNSSTYLLNASEAPINLQCEVVGTNAGGSVAAFSANETSSPAPYPPYPKSTIAPDTHFSETELPLATANLKNAKVTLPQGMTLNPSAANGLAACSSAQVGLTTPVGQASPIGFNEAVGGCPSAAKVGRVEVDTPLLENPLVGSVFLAKPFDNPFSSLLAIYLAVEDEQTGIVAKLAGKVEADPSTGQLTTTFVENPELPIEDVHLSLFNGARASLKTSLVCGTQTTTSVLTPWTTPEGADATPSDSFATVAAPGGGACPSSEAEAPNSPSFTAGTIAPQAGAYSPFTLKLTRPDGSQRLTAIDTTLPPGLSGKLAGIPYCSEAQIAQAQSRSQPNQGALEQQNPSCPVTSEVGTVNVGAGAGPTPVYVQGHAYLAGPYKGAPLSLVIVTPAVTGPFDLGDVVVRTALYVNPETAQIHAVSDALPTILAGVPLDVRSIALTMGRPSFTLNPTSCDPTAISGAATAASGQLASLTVPFQVGGCSVLKFAPKLSLKLKGGTKRNRYPALTATLTAAPGEANIKKASVTFPHSEFLAQNHIRTICTRVQFAANACPAGSIYGKARAVTPLLDKPLEGPVYLRSSSHELPDVVVALHGQVDVVLVGRVDSVKGQIRNTFEAAPDAPISKFTLEMQGGKKGLLVNSRNICASVNKAKVQMDGQNGKIYDSAPVVKADCGKAKKKKKGKGHKKRSSAQHG